MTDKTTKPDKTRPKGPWLHRFAIWVLTLFFALLVFWVLGFLMNDIESIQGPQYSEIEDEYVDQQLEDRLEELNDQIAEAERDIRNKRDEIQIVQSSSNNLQDTISQLIELQKASVQNEAALPEAQQENLSTTLDQFLQAQTRFQQRNEELASLVDNKRQLEDEKQQILDQIEQQREPAREEYNNRHERHELLLAGLQLAILLPLLAVAAWLVAKKRGTMYFPLYLGFGLATLAKTSLVIHEYFPTRYVKYILIGGLLIVVAKVLIYFIRVVVHPKAEQLTKQYREAYERFLCPVCEYPIRIGPRRFLYWTRRTVNKAVPQESADEEEEPYACPSCGTQLFEKCDNCGETRHALLPHCHHCNAEKEVA